MANDFDYNYVPRTVKNHIQSKVMEEAGIPMAHYWAAIGRLSEWAAHVPEYKFLILVHDGVDGDMLANYYPSEEALGKQRPSYQIGAIWREESKTYSFHS